VHAEVALRLLAGVALQTMPGKECAEAIVGLLGRLWSWLSPAAGVGKQKVKKRRREQDGFHGTEFLGGRRRVGGLIGYCNNQRVACKGGRVTLRRCWLQALVGLTRKGRRRCTPVRSPLWRWQRPVCWASA